MKVVYTLSGGAAYGYAHIGVLKYLEESGLGPEAIVGTSMGAIVGGLYACGYKADDIREISEKVKTMELMRLFFPSFPRGGIIDTDGIRDFFKGYVKDTRIEDLDLIYRSVAVDIKTGEEIVFDRGLLIDAMIASMSIPAVFKPYYYGGKYLIDGGVVNNLPWDIAREYGMAHIVVNVAPRREYPRRRLFTSAMATEGGRVSEDTLKDGRGQKGKRADKQQEWNKSDGLGPLKKLREHFSVGEGVSMQHLLHSFVASSGSSDSDQDAGKNPYGLPEIVTNVMAIVNEDVELPKVDLGHHYVYLHPDLRGFSLNDFQKASEIINIGYEAARQDSSFVKGVGRILERSE